MWWNSHGHLNQVSPSIFHDVSVHRSQSAPLMSTLFYCLISSHIFNFLNPDVLSACTESCADGNWVILRLRDICPFSPQWDHCSQDLVSKVKESRILQGLVRTCQDLPSSRVEICRNMSKYCKSWTWPFQTLPQCPFAAFCLASDDHLQSSFPDCLQSGFALAHPSQF
jgi:hypothetical protein